MKPRPINTDAYIAKCKQVNMTDAAIASKLGITEEDVRLAWRQICERSEKLFESGAVSFQHRMHILAEQYKLVGDSLTVVAAQFSNYMTDEELRKLITTDPAQTFANLRGKAIVFRPYVAESPAEALARVEQQHQDELKAN